MSRYFKLEIMKNMMCIWKGVLIFLSYKYHVYICAWVFIPLFKIYKIIGTADIYIEFGYKVEIYIFYFFYVMFTHKQLYFMVVEPSNKSKISLYVTDV